MEYIQTMTKEELLDFIAQDLNVGCSFTDVLPPTEMERIVLKALNWWYQNYYYSVQKAYYLIDKTFLQEDTFIKQKYIQLPHDIQSVTWMWDAHNSQSHFTLGINSPNLSIGLGVSNNAQLSSAMSTIAEIGMYKVILDSFADMMNQLSKYTVKHDFNPLSKRLNIMGGFLGNLIIECFVQVEQEYIFADSEFQEYVTALCLKQLGMIYTRYSYQLQGGVTINGDAILAEGKEREAAVLERIKNIANNSFIIMVKR